MKILNKSQIERLVSIPEVLQAIRQGFIQYSRRETVIPPVASLHLDNGECHIKYGYNRKGEYYIVKIASGFPDNTKVGFPAGNGMMILFDQQSGNPVCLLQDEGYLTDLRTAAAGCLAAMCLAPKNVTQVGIIGTGAQAMYQLKLLTYATQCRKALVWGRDKVKSKAFVNHSELKEWNIEIADSIENICSHCNLIVTTTSSKTPLIYASHLRPGMHVTAVGADDQGKQEISEDVFANADIIAVDSRSQCEMIGDSSYAIRQGVINPSKLIEIGEVLQDTSLGRTSEEQITLMDLTGVAIQDLAIATAVYSRSLS